MLVTGGWIHTRDEMHPVRLLPASRSWTGVVWCSVVLRQILFASAGSAGYAMVTIVVQLLRRSRENRSGIKFGLGRVCRVADAGQTESSPTYPTFFPHTSPPRSSPINHFASRTRLLWDSHTSRRCADLPVCQRRRSLVSPIQIGGARTQQLAELIGRTSYLI
jgi:hypothetical protein